MTILTSILLVVIVSVVFYVAQVYSAINRIESVATTMTNEVSRHNYLSEEAYGMYSTILDDIIAMNSVESGGILHRWEINYAPGAGNSSFDVGTNLAVPQNYGDVAVIEIDLYLSNLAWGISPVSKVDTSLDMSGVRVHTFTYTVPCLRYIK